MVKDDPPGEAVHSAGWVGRFGFATWGRAIHFGTPNGPTSFRTAWKYRSPNHLPVLRYGSVCYHLTPQVPRATAKPLVERVEPLSFIFCGFGLREPQGPAQVQRVILSTWYMLQSANWWFWLLSNFSSQNTSHVPRLSLDLQGPTAWNPRSNGPFGRSNGVGASPVNPVQLRSRAQSAGEIWDDAEGMCCIYMIILVYMFSLRCLRLELEFRSEWLHFSKCWED